MRVGLTLKELGRTQMGDMRVGLTLKELGRTQMGDMRVWLTLKELGRTQMGISSVTYFGHTAPAPNSTPFKMDGIWMDRKTFSHSIPVP
jgi:hypothetical protein